MKRVVFLAAAAATLVQFTKYDLTALQTLGCEIHMVCNMQEGNISQAALQEYNQMFPQLHWHDLPFSDSAGAVRRNHAAYEKLVPLLKELQPDLLHCRGTIAGWYGRRAAQELQIPVFYTAHDFRIFHGCLLAERLWFSAVERKYRKQTSRFFAVCPEDAAYARKHLNCRTWGWTATSTPPLPAPERTYCGNCTFRRKPPCCCLWEHFACRSGCGWWCRQ